MQSTYSNQHSTFNIQQRPTKKEGTPVGLMGICAMNIFDSMRKYAIGWTVTAERNFNADEINSVSSAVVVDSQYGKSVCFHLKAGGQSFIPLSNTSEKSVGDAISLKDSKLVTLSRPGDSDIVRIEA